MNTDPSDAHWVPSHVRITVHQARELHLKTKAGPSEVYVVLQADKKKYSSSSLPKQTCPLWNEDFVIPLMSLATIIHITVRQKGRFGDAYLGYLPISTGNFKINSSPVTHTYKLGSKPGKNSSKLRGDLQISFQFLSEWSEQMNQSVGASMELVGDQTGMLGKSPCDFGKTWTSNGMRMENGVGVAVENHANQPKGKKEIFSSLKRSFKRKSKPAAPQKCEDDFTSFSPHSFPSQLKRSNTLMDTTTSGGHVTVAQYMDTDTPATSAPPAAPFIRGSTADGTVKLVAEKRTEGSVSPSPGGTMITAAKLQYFKSKKRPWSMQGLTVETPMPTVDSRLCQKTPHKDEQELLDEKEPEKSSQIEEAAVSTFKYRSRAGVASRSPRGHERTTYPDDDLENQRLLDGVIGNDSSSKPDVQISPGKDEGSSLCEGDDIRPVEGDGRGLHEGESNGASPKSKRPLTKTHPYSRRVEIIPRTATPASIKSQPQVMLNARTEQNMPSVTPPLTRKNLTILKRRRTTSSLPSNRRLLPATPVPRNVNSQTTGGVSPAVSPLTGNYRLNRRGVQNSYMEAGSLRGDVAVGGIESSSDSKWGNGTQHARWSSRGVGDEGKKKRPVSCIVESMTTPTPAGIQTPTDSKDYSMQIVRRSSRGIGEEGKKRRPVSCIVESMTNPTPAGIQAPTYSKDDCMLIARRTTSQGVISVEDKRRRPMSCIVESRTKPTPAGIQAPTYSKDDCMLIARRPASQGVISVEDKRRRPMSCIVESRTNATPARIMAPTDSKDNHLLPAKVKHTVQYNSAPGTGFQPVSLLPPSLSDYSSWSHTLPVRGKHSKKLSSPQKEPSSAMPTVTTAESQPQSSPVPSRTMNASPTNTMFLPRSAMNYAKTSPIPSEVAKSDAEPETSKMHTSPANSAVTGTSSSITSPSGSNNSSNISTSSDYLSVGYRGRTPGEIVTSAMLKRRTTGGLKKAISLYYESRKHYVAGEGRKGTTPVHVKDGLLAQVNGGDTISEKMFLMDGEVLDRASLSAGSSPDLGRSRNVAESFGSIFMTSLKRTSSLLFTGASKYNSQVAPNMQVNSVSANQRGFHGDMYVNSQHSKKVSAPAILVRTLPSDKHADLDCTAETFEMSQSVTSVVTVASMGSCEDSSSVKTLTDSDSRTTMERRHSPNPAGAASATRAGTYVRHTTSSSVESEGFHSMSGEDTEMEQDWMAWSKENLVKELLQSKQKRKGVEDKLKDTQNELSAIKSYMDMLLLRIIETNPSLLSANC